MLFVRLIRLYFVSLFITPFKGEVLWNLPSDEYGIHSIFLIKFKFSIFYAYFIILGKVTTIFRNPFSIHYQI